MQKKRNELMIFGISLSLLFMILYLTKFNQHIWIIYIAIALLGIALIFPYFFKPLSLIIKPIGIVLIDIVIKIVLVTVFYFLLTPIALIKEIFGVRSMIKIGFEREIDSYFTDKAKVNYDREFFKRLY
ncbi:MAG: hypothetical protein N2746_00155 [Deltaproteobacteria bacterium]|nr:hypothetical protein [Deltaproteobacteria bacterium]